jgi:hypothetical protein
MKTSEQINEIAKAMALAQGELKDPELDAKNPFFNSWYATLGSVVRTLRPIIAKHGLSYMQSTEQAGEKWILKTTVMHTSGQYIAFDYPIHTSKSDAQGFGMGLSYARRYSIKAAFGLADDDNDGNETPQPQPKQQAPKATTSKAVLGPSEAQLKRLHAIASNNQWNPIEVKQMIFEKYGIESSKDLNRDQYNELCDYLEKNKPDLGDIK